MRRFIGGGNPYIDEAFVTTRSRPGAGSPLHSGAHKRNIKTQFRYHDGAFRCGEINILIALDDCGPGDGATLVVPGASRPIARKGLWRGWTHLRCPQVPIRAT